MSVVVGTRLINISERMERENLIFEIVVDGMRLINISIRMEQDKRRNYCLMN